MVVSFQGDHRDQESDEGPKNNINRGESSSSINGGSVAATKPEKMVESAKKKHALLERERRIKINNHYDSIRQLFPRLRKKDKASVLTETVLRIKELKNMVGFIVHEGRSSMGQPVFIPGENDEVSINYCDKKSVRAIICCEDRPNLNHGLMKAIQSAHGKAVMAEMATVGGRTKVDVVVEWPQCHDVGEDVGLLRRALKAVVEDRIIDRAEFMGHGPIEPGLIGLGCRLADGVRPNVYDQTEIGYADHGLIARS